MTRDEILNMPAGREMDALIWLSLNDKPLDILTCRHIDGDVQPHAGYPLGHISPPCYSTDISSAWEVVEKIVENFKCDVSIANRSSGNDCPRIYVCRIQYGTLEYDNPDLLLYVVADTAPLAICRAALLAKVAE